MGGQDSNFPRLGLLIVDIRVIRMAMGKVDGLMGFVVAQKPTHLIKGVLVIYNPIYRPKRLEN